MMKFKSILAVGVCLSCTILFSACASNQKAANKAYAKGKSEYLAQNYDTSFQEIQQAAQAGDPDAQYALGYMYYYGKGTPQDLTQAMEWMRKAAAQGQPQATKALELLAKQDDSQTLDASASSNSSSTLQPQTFTKEKFTLADSSAVSSLAQKPVARNSNTSSVSHHAYLHGVGSMSARHAVNATVRQGGGYTVQLLGAFQREDVINFMREHNLEDKAAFYKTTFQGKAWYVLVYGHYQTISQAKQAIAGLPASLRQQKPWVKPMAEVQAGIRQDQQKGHG